MSPGMRRPADFVDFRIQNKDSASRLRQVEDEIVDELKRGHRVMVRNDSDYAVACATVVEGVKNRLRLEGVRVYQANRLDYMPVLSPEDSDEPLARQKTHHYKIEFSVFLSLSPITDVDNATLQETIVSAKQTKSITT